MLKRGANRNLLETCPCTLYLLWEAEAEAEGLFLRARSEIVNRGLLSPWNHLYMFAYPHGHELFFRIFSIAHKTINARVSYVCDRNLSPCESLSINA